MKLTEEQVTFRGKPLRDLTREEAIEALLQSLEHIARLEGNEFHRRLREGPPISIANKPGWGIGHVADLPST